MKVDGAVALVTGAASGFGKEFTTYFLKNGAKVFAIDINEEEGREFIKQCSEKYGNESVHFMHADVTKIEQLESVFEEVIKVFKRVDIVCNNAGVLGKFHKNLIENFDSEDVRRTVNIDLTSVIEGTYLAIQKMSKRKGGYGGVIINTASVAGLRVAHLIPVYTAVKHGVVAFTHSFKFADNRSEDGIRVNCICPHIVNTPLWNDTNPEVRDRIMEQHKVIEISQVVKALAQCIDDESLNGDAVAVLLDDVIKKVDLIPPKTKI